MTVTTTTNIGRAAVAFPDFNHEGGSGLHTKLTATIKALSDNLMYRYFEPATIGIGANANYTHNFTLALTKIKVVVFVSGVQLTKAEMAAAFTITEVSTSVINIANISGVSKSVAVIIYAAKLGVTDEDIYKDEVLNDLLLATPKISGTPDADGKIGYDAINGFTGQFNGVVGALGGDESFKTIAASTSTVTVKKGKRWFNYTWLNQANDTTSAAATNSWSDDTEYTLSAKGLLYSAGGARTNYLYIKLDGTIVVIANGTSQTKQRFDSSTKTFSSYDYFPLAEIVMATDGTITSITNYPIQSLTTPWENGQQKVLRDSATMAVVGRQNSFARNLAFAFGDCLNTFAYSNRATHIANYASVADMDKWSVKAVGTNSENLEQVTGILVNSKCIKWTIGTSSTAKHLSTPAFSIEKGQAGKAINFTIDMNNDFANTLYKIYVSKYLVADGTYVASSVRQCNASNFIGTSTIQSYFVADNDADTTLYKYSISLVLDDATNDSKIVHWDNIYSGQMQLPMIPRSQDWTVYAPTLTNLGTIASSYFEYAISDGTLFLNGEFTWSALGATSVATISLPPNILTDTWGGSAIRPVGTYEHALINAVPHMVIASPNENVIKFDLADGSQAGFVARTGASLELSLSSGTIKLSAVIPIQGGGAVTAMSVNNVRSHAVYKEFSVTNTMTSGAQTIINYNTKVEDTNNEVTVGASWKFQPKKAAWFTFYACWTSEYIAWVESNFASTICSVSYNGGAEADHKIGPISYLGFNGVGYMSSCVTGKIFLTPVDYITFKGFHNRTAGNCNTNNNPTYNYVEIIEEQPQNCTAIFPIAADNFVGKTDGAALVGRIGEVKEVSWSNTSPITTLINLATLTLKKGIWEITYPLSGSTTAPTGGGSYGGLVANLNVNSVDYSSWVCASSIGAGSSAGTGIVSRTETITVDDTVVSFQAVSTTDNNASGHTGFAWSGKAQARRVG